ncbi:MAG: hypothetical protein QXE81_01450 [Desulfurococcaceae archaeon]
MEENILEEQLCSNVEEVEARRGFAHESPIVYYNFRDLGVIESNVNRI